MSKVREPLSALEAYLPPKTYRHVEKYLQDYSVILTITRERTSVFGNYQWSARERRHRISVNGNLNKFAFLITLLHEFAHMITYQNYGARIAPHGRQWKSVYSDILYWFISKKVFPEDIESELMNTVNNPAASSCTEDSLLRVLRRYDPVKPGFFLVEEIPENSVFRLKNGKTYLRMQKARKRIICKDLSSRKLFYFSPVAEVELVKKVHRT